MKTGELFVSAKKSRIAGGDPKGEEYSYYNLITGRAITLTEAEAVKSKEWHIALKRSVITVNGGKAGMGGIEGACVLLPFTQDNSAFIELTDCDFIKKFDSLKTVPQDIKFTPEGVEPAIFSWRLKNQNKWKHNSGKGWKLRLSDGNSYAKMKLIGMSPDSTSINICYAFQKDKESELGGEKEAAIKKGEKFSIKNSAIVKDDSWDIHFSGDAIYLNSSASGNGLAGTLGSKSYAPRWDNIKDASDSIAYFMDEFGSIFRNPKWYRYNINGKHNIHPNGAVYLLKIDNAFFKLQIYQYYTSKESGIGSYKIRYAKVLVSGKSNK